MHASVFKYVCVWAYMLFGHVCVHVRAYVCIREHMCMRVFSAQRGSVVCVAWRRAQVFSKTKLYDKNNLQNTEKYLFLADI